MTPDEQLFEASYEGNAKAAKAALAAGASVAYRAPTFGLTAFHVAARAGDLALARLLLDRGADLHTRDNAGASPLFHLVLEDDDLDAAEFLLEAGADVDAANKDGWTPLLAACHWDARWNSMVALLLEHGANVNHIAKDDWSPLMLAFQTNAREGPQTVLLEHKRLDLNLVTPQFGWTPLLHASAGTNLEAVRTLLARGAKLDARMKISKQKPYTSRAERAASNVSGAIRAKPEHDGFTALHWAVLKKRRCQKVLLEAGADPKAKSTNGQTPLSLGLPPPAPAAAKSGEAETELLAAIAAKPNDDRRRLVYADWLLEQANPWGEVVQAAVNGRSTAALEKKHLKAFLGPLMPFIRRPKFERGLLSFAACDAQRFPSAAVAIADRAPGATVQLTGLKPKGEAALFAAPLGRFKRVVLEENRLDDAALERLATSPTLQGLEALSVSRNPFSNRGAQALAQSGHLSALRALDVSLTWPEQLSNQTVQALVSARAWPRLESLTLSANGPGLGRALAACTLPLKSVTVFDVAHFTDADALELAKAKTLKHLAHLVLRLSNTVSRLELSDVGAMALLDSKQLRLETLTIEGATRLSKVVAARLVPTDPW